MDTMSTYRELIQKIIIGHTEIPYQDDVQLETIFDRQQDRYLLMLVGREKIDRRTSATKRVHGCLIHIDIIDEKIWIQRDGTEEGVTSELLDAGIPKDKIVLAFYAPEIRQDTGFAVA
ncbi:MAG: XisI protein [Cyanobacteria bacterium P01_E01_bin.42]